MPNAFFSSKNREINVLVKNNRFSSKMAKIYIEVKLLEILTNIKKIIFWLKCNYVLQIEFEDYKN